MSFTFHRGALALDFVGTLGARASDRPVERVPDPTTLARWLREAGLVEAAVAAPTSIEYQLAVGLREAIARACGALVDGESPSVTDVETINQAARDVMLGAVYLDRGQLTERWRTQVPIRVALGRLAEDAIHVIARERDRLTRCQLDSCGALLLSGHRGEPRRWCSMQTCGNRAKVAAFRSRASHAS
jgi:predicted RNA-binding Zn ribbon-like protein